MPAGGEASSATGSATEKRVSGGQVSAIRSRQRRVPPIRRQGGHRVRESPAVAKNEFRRRTVKPETAVDLPAPANSRSIRSRQNERITSSLILSGANAPCDARKAWIAFA